jgi:hypothetical protein
MRCPRPRSTTVRERPERTAQGANRVFQDGDDLVDHCCYAWGSRRAECVLHSGEPTRWP